MAPKFYLRHGQKTIEEVQEELHNLQAKVSALECLVKRGRDQHIGRSQQRATETRAEGRPPAGKRSFRSEGTTISNADEVATEASGDLEPPSALEYYLDQVETALKEISMGLRSVEDSANNLTSLEKGQTSAGLRNMAQETNSRNSNETTETIEGLKGTTDDRGAVHDEDNESLEIAAEKDINDLALDRSIANIQAEPSPSPSPSRRSALRVTRLSPPPLPTTGWAGSRDSYISSPGAATEREPESNKLVTISQHDEAEAPARILVGLKLDRQANTRAEENSMVTELSTLQMHDLGERIVPNILALEADTHSPQRILVENLPPVDWDEVVESMPTETADMLEMEFRKGEGPEKGYAHIYRRGDTARTAWKQTTASVRDLTPKDAELRFDQIAADPPSDPIGFYYGQCPREFMQGVLHSGDPLAKMDDMQFVNSPRLQIGEANSAVCIHKEAFHLRAMTLVCTGQQLWMFIDIDDTGKFEQFVKAHWPECPKCGVERKYHNCLDCSQFVEHRCLFLAPSRLRAEGIRFEMRCAGPGDLITTKPFQYYSVLNNTASMSLCINFLAPGLPVVPFQTTICPEDGMWPLCRQSDLVVDVTSESYRSQQELLPQTEHLAEKKADSREPLSKRSVNARTSINQPSAKTGSGATKRPASESFTATNQKRARSEHANPGAPDELSLSSGNPPSKERPGSDDLDLLIRHYEGLEPTTRMTAVRNAGVSGLKAVRIALSLRGTEVLERFVAMVESYNKEMNAQRYASKDALEEAAESMEEGSILNAKDALIKRGKETVRKLDYALKSGSLSNLAVRLQQKELAQVVHDSQMGQLRAQSEVVRAVETETGWGTAKRKQQLKRGHVYRKLCGSGRDKVDYEGLLCFMFDDNQDNPYNLTSRAYWDLDDGAIKLLRDHLLKGPLVAAINEAGKALIRAIKARQPVRFAWEGKAINWKKVTGEIVTNLLEETL